MARRVHCQKAAGPVLLAALLCAACASSPKTRYYTLRTPQPPAAIARGTEFSLQVERFEAPDLLLDNRMIYYTSPSELNFHEYHRWSSDPGDLLSDLAMKFFAKTSLFRQVYAYPAPVKVDYTLSGRVLDIDELKYETGGGKSGEARLGLKLDLLQVQQNKVVWSSRLEQTVPIQGGGVQGAVEAMNIAAERLLQNAYGGISQAVEHNGAQKQQEETAH
ncbi:MAG TPA: ABC-type transport auxiliary lipoprotein family protein [Terriglobia bacterium]|nr:ABC-type transport auxiliary lipoprotein family protein [Terriglobia bacterium]